MMRRLAFLFCMVLGLGLALSACGRKGEPMAPEGARADAPRVPPRGSTVLYPY